MSDQLSTQLPDGFIQIMDNDKAKLFLFALGILSDLQKEITLSKDAARCNDNTIFVAYYGHPTHWILASRFYGNHNESENGFAVNAWPRKEYSRAIIEEILDKVNLGDKVSVKVEKFGDQKPPLS